MGLVTNLLILPCFSLVLFAGFLFEILLIVPPLAMAVAPLIVGLYSLFEFSIVWLDPILKLPQRFPFQKNSLMIGFYIVVLTISLILFFAKDRHSSGVKSNA